LMFDAWNLGFICYLLFDICYFIQEG